VMENDPKILKMIEEEEDNFCNSFQFRKKKGDNKIKYLLYSIVLFLFLFLFLFYSTRQNKGIRTIRKKMAKVFGLWFSFSRSYASSQFPKGRFSVDPTRPNVTRSLVREFIHDSLYNPGYGYFSHSAEILSFPKPIDFNSIKNQAHLEQVMNQQYSSSSSQIWHTPVEVFKVFIFFFFNSIQFFFLKKNKIK